MAEYQLTAITGTTKRTADTAFIPGDHRNRDARDYQDWLDAGNKPDPAPPPPVQGVIEQSSLALALQQAEQNNNRGHTQDAITAILNWMETLLL